jgi:hypothetical protein
MIVGGHFLHEGAPEQGFSHGGRQGGPPGLQGSVTAAMIISGLFFLACTACAANYFTTKYDLAFTKMTYSQYSNRLYNRDYCAVVKYDVNNAVIAYYKSDEFKTLHFLGGT